MGVPIKVRKVLINGFHQMFIMNTLLIASIVVFLLSIGMPVLNVWLHPFLLPCIGLIFFYMMVEDFKHQIVEMRVWFMLFLCMQQYFFFSVQFYRDFAVGIVLFFALFSISWRKIAEPQDIQQGGKEQPVSAQPQYQLGLLPSLGIALLIGSFLPMPSPVILFAMDYDALSSSPYFVLVCIAVFLAACLRQCNLYKTLRQGQTVQYCMGGGDSWVCAAWCAFLGLPAFSFILFIALCIQLLLYCIVYFYQKSGEFNENK